MSDVTVLLIDNGPLKVMGASRSSTTRPAPPLRTATATPYSCVAAAVEEQAVLRWDAQDQWISGHGRRGGPADAA